jgi:hypothetical protein
MRWKGEKTPSASLLQLNPPDIRFTTCNEIHVDVLEGQEQMGPYHLTRTEHSFPCDYLRSCLFLLYLEPNLRYLRS